MDPAFNYDTISAAIHNQFSIHPNVVLDETAAKTNTFNSNVSSQTNTSCPTVNTTASSSTRHSRSGSSYYYYNCQYETEIFKALESLSLTSSNSDSNDANNTVNYTYRPHRHRSHTSSFTTLPPLFASNPQEPTPHAETTSTDKKQNYDQTQCCLSGNKTHLDEEMIDAGTANNDTDCELDNTLPLHHISTIHHQILQQEKAEEELAEQNKL